MYKTDTLVIYVHKCKKRLFYPLHPTVFFVVWERGRKKLFLILMYIKLPIYLKWCRMGGGRSGVRGKGRLFLKHC
jgi:hypothetical protein